MSALILQYRKNRKVKILGLVVLLSIQMLYVFYIIAYPCKFYLQY